MTHIIDKIQLSGITYQIQGSGGGKAIEAGRGITITTGETADTVSFNLPISAGTGTNSIVEGGINNRANVPYSHAEGQGTKANGSSSHAEGQGTKANGSSSHAEGWSTQANGNYGSHAEGYNTTASGQSSHAEGSQTTASGDYSHVEGSHTEASGQSSHAEGSWTVASGFFSHAEGLSTSATSFGSHAEGASTQANGQYSHAEGYQTSAMTYYSHAEGYYTIANNESEHASGQYNVSSSASTTFGNSGNTLFSVGNGTANNARHNAFEIRQNGDIYLSSGGTDIKLQDHLGGGGSVTVDTELDSGSTNPVENRVIYNKIDEIEEVTAAGLNALNDKITPTVELTQAQYDALVDKDPNTYYIITDATPVDMSNYYTTAQTNTLLAGKQATLVSGTNIKTINNESILGSGNIDIQGGSTYTAGRGISIANDTISFNLPISANTKNSIVMGGKINNSFTNNGRDCLMVGSEDTISNGSDFCLLVGYRCSANGDGSAVIGYGSRSTGDTSFAFGYEVSATTTYSFATGYRTITKNNYEHTSGLYNVSNIGSTYADKTIFSVGNGTSTSARHNAFEIRQNGDIYLTKDGQDVKLQDQLGGSSITVDTALDSGSTNPVENRVIYNKIDEVEQVTARALNELNDNFGGLKLVKLTQAEYNALATKDPSTLYVIVD